MDVVTGGTGHLGNALVRALLSRGRDVRVLARTTSDLVCFKGLDIEVVRGDVLDQDSLISAFRGAENVYHTAGLVTFGIPDSDKLHAVNVTGTENVVEACIGRRIRRLIYVSTIEALDLMGSSRPVTESAGFHPDRTIMEYGKTKAIASIDILRAVETRGLDAVLVCPTGFIGPFDYKISAIGKLLIDYINRKIPVILEGGFDFVDIRDVADGMCAATDYGHAGENYILSGNYISVAEIMRAIGNYSGIPSPEFRLPYRLAYCFSYFAERYYYWKGMQPRYTRNSIKILSLDVRVSSDKARGELGYVARPFERTVEDTIDWLEGEGFLSVPTE